VRKEAPRGSPTPSTWNVCLSNERGGISTGMGDAISIEGNDGSRPGLASSIVAARLDKGK